MDKEILAKQVLVIVQGHSQHVIILDSSNNLLFHYYFEVK